MGHRGCAHRGGASRGAACSAASRGPAYIAGAKACSGTDGGTHPPQPGKPSPSDDSPSSCVRGEDGDEDCDDWGSQPRDGKWWRSTPPATSATTSHHTTALTERRSSPHRVDGSKAVGVWETSKVSAQRVTPSAAVSDSSGPESAPRGAEGGESEHWGTARRELQHDDVKIFGENMQEVVGVPAELPAADESTPADAPKYVSMPN
jgi:hypothetical protein